MIASLGGYRWRTNCGRASGAWGGRVTGRRAGKEETMKIALDRCTHRHPSLEELPHRKHVAMSLRERPDLYGGA
jgi:hypothetical protein